MSEDSMNEEIGLPENGDVDQQETQQSSPQTELPPYAKAKLGKMEKRHQRKVDELHSRIAELEGRMMGTQQSAPPSYADNGVESSEDERIRRAVTMALSHQENEKAQEAHRQNQQYVSQHYQDFARNLEDAADDIDDFEEVTGQHKNLYTPEMATVASIMPPKLAAKVLYHLGKNPEELQRINSAHPLKQGREMMNLLLSLHAGESAKNVKSSDDGIFSSMKTNSSVSSSNRNGGDIASMKRRMREGTFK